MAVTNLLYCAFVQIPSECTYDGVYSLIMQGNLHVRISKNIDVVSTVCMKELKVNGCAFSAYSGSKG